MQVYFIGYCHKIAADMTSPENKDMSWPNKIRIAVRNLQDWRICPQVIGAVFYSDILKDVYPTIFESYQKVVTLRPSTIQTNNTTAKQFNTNGKFVYDNYRVSTETSNKLLKKLFINFE